MGSALRPLLVLMCTGFLLAGACFTAFGLWFAPGWANDWPLGLPRNLIWPAGLSCVAFGAALVLTAGIGAAARVGDDPPRPLWPPDGWYRKWLVAGLVTSVVVASAVFVALRSRAVALWP